MILDLSWTGIIIVLCSLVLAPYAMGLFNLGKNHFSVADKTVLLTGGSEGMGLSVAKILARKGANIVIAARTVEKLESALQQIKAEAPNSSQRFHYISADVSKADEASRIVSEVTIWNNGQAPDIVWCMAGASQPSLFLDVSQSQLRHMMDVNYWSQADMAHSILASWLSPSSISSIETEKQKSPRHLIFTSSSLAFYSIVGYGAYSPAKTALRSLSDTLAQEVLLYTPSVKIHTVFPGSISTAGFERENLIKPAITKELEKDDPVQTPEVVATRAVLGLERGEYLITVNFLAAAMRGCAWGGSSRNNWVIDTLMTWATSIAWMFIGGDLNGKVVKYGKQHGHPSTYGKGV